MPNMYKKIVINTAIYIFIKKLKKHLQKSKKYV